eukprot:6188845-Pleurochrysis_carterae.AAC.2
MCLQLKQLSALACGCLRPRLRGRGCSAQSIAAGSASFGAALMAACSARSHRPSSSSSPAAAMYPPFGCGPSLGKTSVTLPCAPLMQSRCLPESTQPSWRASVAPASASSPCARSNEQ